jgi:hypothetical protein
LVPAAAACCSMAARSALSKRTLISFMGLVTPVTVVLRLP